MRRIPRTGPGHILHLMVMVGPDGNVVAKHWKQRNVRGLFPGSEHVHVFDLRRVRQICRDVWRGRGRARSSRRMSAISAMSAVQFEPELFRCFAFKGAEIICRVATGGFEYEDMRLTSYHNSVYTMIANNSVTTQGAQSRGSLRTRHTAAPDVPQYSDRAASRSPRPACSRCKQFALLPMAEFRKKHRIPDVHMELYQARCSSNTVRATITACYLDNVPAGQARGVRAFR